MEPIVFTPLYQQRVWGGRELETRFGRALPDDGQPYGEAWEMVDREDEQSVVSEGEHQGRTLHELWTQRREELFGERLDGERFPLLIKILDARDDLSIQVHPPQAVAKELGGEPKTEMWYIAGADPGAKLYAGVNEGVNRQAFATAIDEGKAEQVVPAFEVSEGDSLFIPSGLLHAIGAGLVIFEIQQNSDTTYRVYDWGRLGLDGKPRDLHVKESLQSILFDEGKPKIDAVENGPIASCEHFHVEARVLAVGEKVCSADRFKIVMIVEGSLEGGHRAGRTLLLPRGGCEVIAGEATRILVIEVP